MPKYELAIAVIDEQDHAPGLTRKKEGEIVCVKSHPAHWGRKAIDEYFIVIVETNATLEEMQKFHAKRLYRFKSNGLPVTEEEYFELTEAEPPNTSEYLPSDFEMAAKNRYAISFSDIQSMAALNMSKVQDKHYIYQPFKKASQVVQGFDGINGRHLLTEHDVDCRSGSITAKKEFSFNLDTTQAVILDKYTNTMIKPIVA